MERISRFRAILLLILFITILALFALKLFDLQIIKTNGNTDNIAKYTTVTTVRAARGDILDRNGNVLVGTAPVMIWCSTTTLSSPTARPTKRCTRSYTSAGI